VGKKRVNFSVAGFLSAGFERIAWLARDSTVVRSGWARVKWAFIDPVNNSV